MEQHKHCSRTSCLYAYNCFVTEPRLPSSTWNIVSGFCSPTWHKSEAKLSIHSALIFAGQVKTALNKKNCFQSISLWIPDIKAVNSWCLVRSWVISACRKSFWILLLCFFFIDLNILKSYLLVSCSKASKNVFFKNVKVIKERGLIMILKTALPVKKFQTPKQMHLWCFKWHHILSIKACVQSDNV